jgi:hypothetical protein
MSRQPKIRVHYAADRGHLIRLRNAVERDERQCQEWRKEVSRHLTCLEQLFLSADMASDNKP